jgi:acyl-coenzyme A synthetase/AMP-(fatty) acid ligase
MRVPGVSAAITRLRVALGGGLTLANLADTLAAMHGNAVALHEEHPDGAVRKLTYDQLAAQVARWSAAVSARTRPGDSVVVATPNGVDQMMVCLAVARAGRLPAPVNAQMSEVEVGHVIADAGATLVVRSGTELDRGQGSRSTPEPPVVAQADDIAALFYTSGTTGAPKGAELTHRALVGGVASTALVPPMPGGAEVLMALPVAHIMGFVGLLGPFLMGAPIYFMDRFHASRVLDVIEGRRVAAFVGVPAMYRMLLEAGAADRDLSSIRVFVSGADVIPAELARVFKSMGSSFSLPLIGGVGEAFFLEGYGMVEVGGGVAAKVSPPLMSVGLGDSLGVPLPGWRMRVVDSKGRPVGTGKVGELQLKGPGVLKGYHGDPDSTAAVLTSDGWLRTGDLVRAGTCGTVVFQGRTKHVVKSGGYSVYPVEVEADLEEHPDVLEAAVVGLPHPKLGEMTAAAVRLRPGSKLTAEALQAWAESRMAHYKAPKRFVIVDDLPRTGTRKVQRGRVADLFPAA